MKLFENKYGVEIDYKCHFVDLLTFAGNVWRDKYAFKIFNIVYKCCICYYEPYIFAHWQETEIYVNENEKLDDM